MPFVSVVLNAAKVTTATYRILATLVMGYYLVKGIRDYEKQQRRKQEASDG